MLPASRLFRSYHCPLRVGKGFPDAKGPGRLGAMADGSFLLIFRIISSQGLKACFKGCPNEGGVSTQVSPPGMGHMEPICQMPLSWYKLSLRKERAAPSSRFFPLFFLALSTSSLSPVPSPCPVPPVSHCFPLLLPVWASDYLGLTLFIC